MSGHIILRDIPKQVVRLDAWDLVIEGGFRGFGRVPAGIHFTRVLVDGSDRGSTWCFLRPGEVLVYVHDFEKNMLNMDRVEERVASYTELARSGAMNRAFVDVGSVGGMDMDAWLSITRHVNATGSVPALHSEKPMMPPANGRAVDVETFFHEEFKSRFLQAYIDTHHGNVDTYVAEIEFALVKFLGEGDPVARDRWMQLVLGAFNAGEHAVMDHPEAFIELVPVVSRQLEALMRFGIHVDEGVLDRARWLADDIEDCAVAGTAALPGMLRAATRP